MNAKTITKHDKVRMLVDAETEKPVNGSLTEEVTETWVPLLDALTDDRWVLTNVGPQQNVLLLPLDDDETVWGIVVNVRAPFGKEFLHIANETTYDNEIIHACEVTVEKVATRLNELAATVR